MPAGRQKDDVFYKNTRFLLDKLQVIVIITYR